MKSLFRLSSLAFVSWAVAIPYEEYILAPRSRTLFPVSIHSSNGSVSNPESLTVSPGSATFEGDSATAYDFAKNIAGVVTLEIGAVSDAEQYIGVTFSESSLWVSNQSCDATADAGKDEILWLQVTGPGRYTAPREKERGAFRYMTLVHDTIGSVEVTSAEVYFTPMPHWEDESLAEYTGYFHCDDELLNRIWYAGAYTNQMCTIDPHYGNSLVHLFQILPGISDATNVTWYHNSTVTNGSSALVDGGKRDRLAAQGDMVVAMPGVLISTNDIISIENSLNSFFGAQNASNGQLPYAPPPFPSGLSFTYHLYALIGVADHYLYTGDIKYLTSLWDKWKLGINFSISFIDDTGLMNVSSAYDWLRFGMGGHNIEANSIFYYTLNRGIVLAQALNDTGPISLWQSTAERVKAAANELLWDEAVGMYIDNETTTLMPQDGNSWAVVSNITVNSSQIESISKNLVDRWTPYGAPALEAAHAISPFISSFELQAHFLAKNVTAALALMRLQWGFMLDDPRMTNSTFIEGYSSTGEMNYPPYVNDARISHSHGWSTGPTSALTFYVAGIQLRSAGGKTWRIAPTLGDLKFADAGFSTRVGFFSAKTQISESGWDLEFEAPEGTTGELRIPSTACIGKVALQEASGKCDNINVEVSESNADPVTVLGILGGKWRATCTCG
ncbi:glycoside hydrolase family 78 protein [Lentithecium fluviatile CBS 122367]|uniref:Glycoside hydrolase family 78 protein n=1 Tax=Lentithecium fluviatile CBS 122367 TaxID=1168545 RepID=A0A6G1JA14_9PLEO|nr:glycoside hydrolase family 78 protein [Lentithecium fluviatile CBS 122367]